MADLGVEKGKNVLITFLCCFPTNVDEIRSDAGPCEDLGTHQFLSSLVGKQPRKLDLPFRTDVCRLGQATVVRDTSGLSFFAWHHDQIKGLYV